MSENIVITSDKVIIAEKKHIGNLRLSTSKKAIKIHIFETDRFYVIPNQEIQDKKVGKIFEYVDSSPEVIGEIHPIKNGSKFYELHIKANIYYAKRTYIEMLLKGSELTLQIREE